MGLANALAMFVRMMNPLFGTLSFLKVDMDDILIHSTDIYEHFGHLKEFFQAS